MPHGLACVERDNRYAARMTFSIVARDEQNEQMGIAVQSRYFGVGRIVPFVEAGVGVIASQAFSNPLYGREGLRSMREGTSPSDALARLVERDPENAIRQVAMLDAKGRIAQHTGSRCIASAHHAVGKDVATQANTVATESTSRAMIDAFERARGSLGDRLVVALEAAQHEGGDIRGVQAAALVVVSTTTDGDRIDVRVDDHAQPIAEIKRLLAYATAQTRAAGAIEKASTGRIDEAIADVEASIVAFPNDPDFLARRGFVFMMGGRIPEARDAFAQARAVQPMWSEYVLRMADAGIIPIPREVLSALFA